MRLSLKTWLRKPLFLRRVRGESMKPTLNPGILVVATSLLPPKSGRIVLAIVDGQEIIKRVGTISKNYVELLGDNMILSHDSRHVGLVPRTQIIGRVL